MSNIFNLIEKFNKLAALQVPTEIVNQIFNAMKPIYLGALAHKATFIDDKKIRTSLLSQILAQGPVKPFSGEIATAKLTYSAEIFPQINIEKAKAINFEEIKLNAAICFTEQIRNAIKSTKWNGLYKEDLKQADGRDGIKNTIEHEVQHLVQNLIGLINIGYKDLERLPRGGLTPGSNPYEWKSQSRGESELPHDLRDVEFYPVLSGSIAKLKSQIKLIPEDVKDLYVRAWIGELSFEEFLSKAMNKLSQSENIDIWKKMKNPNLVLSKEKFFHQLRSSNLEKWKKTVSELTKSIL